MHTTPKLVLEMYRKTLLRNVSGADTPTPAIECRYMAPELIGTDDYGTAVDLWSFGAQNTIQCMLLCINCMICHRLRVAALFDIN